MSGMQFFLCPGFYLVDGGLARRIGAIDLLASMAREVEANLASSSLFSAVPLDELWVYLDLNRPAESGHSVMPTSFERDERWKYSERKRRFTCSVVADITAWSSERTKAGSAPASEDLRSYLLKPVACAIACVALETHCPPAKVRDFLAGFGASIEDLGDRVQPMSSPPSDESSSVEVQITHDGGSPSDVLANRARIRELLETVVVGEGLGVLEGSASGERHFEFNFLVTDLAKAMSRMKQVLEGSGLSPDSISFEVL